jgi:hypothetical protein
MLKFLKAAFATDAQITAQITAKLDAEDAAKKATDTRGLWDEELGCWMGTAGSTERFLWILADQDRDDREDALLAEILRNRQS